MRATAVILPFNERESLPRLVEIMRSPTARGENPAGLAAVNRELAARATAETTNRKLR